MFVERILHNLVVNARDAMPRGGTITVSTSDAPMGPDGRAMVALEVRDTGCGMDEVLRARIFEPCFTTKENGNGSGFGLPTIRRLLDDVGGTIEVESEPGSGTVFRLGLPRADAV